MDIFTHDTLPIGHPEWCAAPFCENAHPHDYRHASVPVLLDTPVDDVEITLTRMRDDEYVPWSSEWLEHTEGVLLSLRNVASVTEAGEAIAAEVLLCRSALRRLVRELTALDAQVWGDTSDGRDGVPERYCPTCGSAIIRGYCSNPCCPSWVDEDGAR